MTHRNYIVSIEDSLNPTLTSRAEHVYSSPPHTLEQAQALLGLLVRAEFTGEDGTWRLPMPGGSRTVTVQPA